MSQLPPFYVRWAITLPFILFLYWPLTLLAHSNFNNKFSFGSFSCSDALGTYLMLRTPLASLMLPCSVTVFDTSSVTMIPDESSFVSRWTFFPVFLVAWIWQILIFIIRTSLARSYIGIIYTVTAIPLQSDFQCNLGAVDVGVFIDGPITAL